MLSPIIVRATGVWTRNSGGVLHHPDERTCPGNENSSYVCGLPILLPFPRKIQVSVKAAYPVWGTNAGEQECIQRFLTSMASSSGVCL